MNNFMKIAAVGAGMAAVAAGASPASAQDVYGNGYASTNGGGVIGAIVNAVTGGGYGQYPQGNYGYAQANTRSAVSQCTAAVEQGRSGYGSGYGSQGYYQGQGYQGQGYQGYQSPAYQGQSGLRVVGITGVERRGNGGLKVTGVAQGSAYAGYSQRGYEDRDRDGRPDGYNQGYGEQGYGQQAYGSAQSRVGFSCKVDGRGVVTDVRVAQNNAYRRGY